jgi:hypothetical protein
MLRGNYNDLRCQSRVTDILDRYRQGSSWILRQQNGSRLGSFGSDIENWAALVNRVIKLQVS